MKTKLSVSQLLIAAKIADWEQVIGNGGPPCFHLENGRFCLRAGRWDGHKQFKQFKGIHKYISLEDLLRSLTIKTQCHS